jgi:hypothetical protein
MDEKISGVTNILNRKANRKQVIEMEDNLEKASTNLSSEWNKEMTINDKTISNKMTDLQQYVTEWVNKLQHRFAAITSNLEDLDKKLNGADSTTKLGYNGPTLCQSLI